MSLTHRPSTNQLQAVLLGAQRDIDRGRLAQAESKYRSAIRFLPDKSQLHLILGLLLFEQGRFDSAAAELEAAVRLAPDNPNAYCGLGDALDAVGRSEAAITAYQTACRLDPTYTRALLQLGNAYQKIDRYERALHTFGRILELHPEHPKALNNMGKTYHDMGQLNHAEELYHRALKRNPDYAEAHFNRAVVRIAKGDYARGWAEYEWRFKRKTRRNIYPHRLASPRWNGRRYPGKRLLVHCEQGLGDVLQFARYFQHVKDQGGRLIVEAQGPLLPLLEHLDCLDALVAFDAARRPSVPHDLHIPLMSLPHVLGTTVASIPDRFPYLTVPPSRYRDWQRRLTPAGLRVGLVWASSSVNPKRNVALRDCLEWLQMPGLTFFSLQKGPAADDIRALGASAAIRDMGPRLEDFADTAALIAHMDLVISVDTAVAHLAGAMGKPLWVLLPLVSDWRWPHQLTRSPWYPAATLFHQTRLNDWSEVCRSITQSLQQWRKTHMAGDGPPPLARGYLSDTRNVPRLRQPTCVSNARTQAVSPLRCPLVQGTIHSRHSQDRRPSRSPRHRVKRVLLVSPIYGGSLDIARYLADGFSSSGRVTMLIDNSSFYPLYRRIHAGAETEREKQTQIHGLLEASDKHLMAYVDQFKPDLIMAVAQSPLCLHTLAELKKKGIRCAYWFVEDYRFKTYWSQIAAGYDFFFMIQRDPHLISEFSRMKDTQWRYLPLACDPSMHKPWTGPSGQRRAFECQIGFMGAPYRNRLHVFDKLTDFNLKIWGEGWGEQVLSCQLEACVQEGRKRISPEDTVRIYSSAQILVNLHSSPFDDDITAEGEFVNPRTFEIAGCCGFQLTDYRKELPHVFEPDKEIILFHDLDELKSLISDWLPRDRLRSRIARQAQQRAYRDHTYTHRANEILHTVETA